MTSLITNTSAMVALQTLRGINSGLDSTNTRVSTGLRINSAQDGAAYWSIATTTRSDNGALGAAKDALALGKSSVDVAKTGMDESLDALKQVKNLLVTASSPDADRAKIQQEIKIQLDRIQGAANSASTSGNNWLSVDSSATGYNAIKSVVGSFSRNSTGVTIDTIDIDTTGVKLYDSSAVVGADGIMDKSRTNGGSTTSVAAINISALTGSAADLTTISEYMSIVDDALGDMTDANTTLGANAARIASQSNFAQALIDANDRAIGALVDADMEAESTKLKALQTQQQLAIQSLSIANSSTQNVLSLFRS